MSFKEIKELSNRDREKNTISCEDGVFKFENKKFELKILHPDQLSKFEVDKRYMRQLNQPHASNIIKSFAKYYGVKHLCQYTYPISVSVRNDGSKIIIDGQHRVYSAVETGKSLFAVFYHGLSLQEEMILYLINNNIKMQSANHRMNLLSRLDKNVKKIYDILDNHLIGWDSESPLISRLNFCAAISLSISPTPKRDIKKLPSFLDTLEDIHFEYFDQILSILNEAHPYKPSLNVKKRGKDSGAESFWQRADLYLAAVRFVVVYHMRFGNDIKNSEKIVEFLSSYIDWENIYQKSKIKSEGGGKFYTILNDLIGLYNKGRRNFDYMIPIHDHKMFNKKNFPYFNNHTEMKKISVKDAVEKEVKNIKNKIEKEMENTLNVLS